MFHIIFTYKILLNKNELKYKLIKTHGLQGQKNRV